MRVIGYCVHILNYALTSEFYPSKVFPLVKISLYRCRLCDSIAQMFQERKSRSLSTECSCEKC